MDPRIERTRQAVRQATLDVLSRGYASFTVEAVAESARVAKSTIYRHWPTRIALVADALEGLNVQPRPDPATGTARERIGALVEHLAAALAGSLLSACIPALIEAAEHHPEVAAFLHGYSADRRRTLVAAIRAGVDTGELPAYLDPELAALALSGPAFYCRTMTPDPLTPDQARRLVTQVLGPAPEPVPGR